MTDIKCPICGKDLQWKLSGRGRHFGGVCKEHGIVSIVRHPLYNPQPRKAGLFERVGDYIWGR